MKKIEIISRQKYNMIFQSVIKSIDFSIICVILVFLHLILNFTYFDNVENFTEYEIYNIESKFYELETTNEKKYRFNLINSEGDIEVETVSKEIYNECRVNQNYDISSTNSSYKIFIFSIIFLGGYFIFYLLKDS